MIPIMSIASVRKLEDDLFVLFRLRRVVKFIRQIVIYIFCFVFQKVLLSVENIETI